LKKIAIIDYGMGNIFSIKTACQKASLSGIISCDEKEIMKSDAVILPGVGSFNAAMKKIKLKNLDKTLNKFFLTKKPMIGICLGMQLFFEKSYEYSITKGLGLIKGEVNSIDKNNHLNIGWYEIKKKKSHKILENIPDETHMYFVHSYVCKPESEKVILTETFYNNNRFCSSIQNENLFGFQFHPEKSGEKGLNIYYSLKKLL